MMILVSLKGAEKRCGKYPMYEISTSLPSGTFNVKLPSKSVIVPTVVPTTFTEAPIIGCSVSSKTTPLNVFVFWAIAGIAIIKAKSIHKQIPSIFLYFIFILL